MLDSFFCFEYDKKNNHYIYSLPIGMWAITRNYQILENICIP